MPFVSLCVQYRVQKPRAALQVLAKLEEINGKPYLKSDKFKKKCKAELPKDGPIGIISELEQRVTDNYQLVQQGIRTPAVLSKIVNQVQICPLLYVTTSHVC